jgi:hydrogenase/urease accessory protein HupE
VLLFCLAATGHADVFRPAYLELRELGGDRYEVLWKVPALADGRRLRAHVEFPPDTARLTEPRAAMVNDAWVERYRISHPGGLVGETVAIRGISGGVTDVIARVQRLDGTTQVARLLPENPRFEVEPPAGVSGIAWSYLSLGVEHILTGVDHLLFVLALLLVVRGGRRIVATITAFTVAHSITLGAASLGWMHLPPPPVEAIIALSIVFVAAEVARAKGTAPGLTARAPWVVAFSFGLLHGLGFAGALAEIGLPETAIPLALLMFNVGVEIGQLLFVLAIVAARAAFAHLTTRPLRWGTTAPAYAIGTVAACWTLERVASFW